MAPRSVPGGRDSRGTCVRVRAAAGLALPRPISPTSPGSASATCSSRPHQRRAAMPPEGAGEYVEILVHQPHRRHLFGCCPTTSSSPGRRPTSTSCAGPATAPETVPSPSCTTQVRYAHGRNPEPSAGVIDSCSIKVSPVRGPRGFDGVKKIDGIKRHVVVDTLGLLVAVLVTAASVQDRAAVPRLLGRARYRCPGARPSVRRPGLHRQRRAGREQEPAVHDPDRRRDQSQGRLYHPASSPGRRADIRLDAPLPTPHPPVRADPTCP
jgi:hypothetical protein